MKLTAASFIGTASNTPIGNEGKVLANANGNVTAVFYPLNFVLQSAGTGNGVLTAFTLSNPPIVADSQSVYVNGVLKTETTDYTIVDATGVITFLVAPADTLPITATYKGTISKTQALVAGQEIELGGGCTGITSTASVTIS